MRNLTLGTIIVVGGLLAAIPFRRDAVHPESSDPNALATGPTTAPFAIATSDPLSPPWDTESSVAGQVASAAGPSQATGWPNHRGPDPPSQAYAAPSQSAAFSATGPNAIPSQQPARPRRDGRLPLTYNDLAVPLSNPHFPDRRFNALSGSPSNPMARQSVPPVGMAEARVQGTSPASHSNVAADPRVATSSNSASAAAAREESTPAQLASSGPASQAIPDAQRQVLRPPTLDLHGQPASQQPARSRSFKIPEVEMPAMPPAPSVMERQRHWIRQPE